MILRIFLFDGLYSVTSYSNFVYEIILICLHSDPTIMTEVNVSVTVGISSTVGEMSVTVGRNHSRRSLNSCV